MKRTVGQKEKETKEKKRAHARHPLGWTGRMRAIPYRWHTVFPCLYGYLLVLPLALPHLLDLSSFSLYSACFFLNFVSIPSFIHFLFFFFPSLSVSRSIFVFIFFKFSLKEKDEEDKSYHFCKINSLLFQN